MSNRLQSDKLCCPHCGSYYSSGLTDWNYPEWKVTTQYGSVVFKSRSQARIFDLLWRKQGIKGLTRERIVDIIYADDPDGGPELHYVSQEFMRMRKLLIPTGIAIKRGFSGGEGYSLVFVNPAEAAKYHNG